MEKVYTTKTASQLLGVTIRTVQLWVENGSLSAWRTQGGHRRISADSLETMLKARNKNQVSDKNQASTSNQEISILIAEDDEALCLLYEAVILGWGIPIKIEIVKNGFEALISLGRNIPNILITDISMPGMDGVTMLQQIRADDKFTNVEIIVISGLDGEQIQSRGGVPKGVSVFLKPVPFALIQKKIQSIANQNFMKVVKPHIEQSNNE